MIAVLRRISVAMAALPMLVAGAARGDDKGYASEPLEQVKSKLESKKAVLVDVRERKEWDRGHIKGAVLVPLSVLVEWEREGIPAEEKAKLAKALPEGSVVYCHCAAGARAVPGAKALRKLGYQAKPLKAGYRALVEAGFPRASAEKKTK